VINSYKATTIIIKERVRGFFFFERGRLSSQTISALSTFDKPKEEIVYNRPHTSSILAQQPKK
jgi:hypothetical protein